MSNPEHNAIVVFHVDGVVDHRFCDTAYAKSTADNPDCLGWSAFILQNVSAEAMYTVSPQIRGAVESAKTKLREQLRIKAALDKHGISPEMEVRHAMHEAFSELRFEIVSAGFARVGGYADAAQTHLSDDARTIRAINGCKVPLDDALRQALNAAFRELLAN